MCSDEKELKYYPVYTQSACEVECETNDLVSECQCRDAYMPSTGPSEYYTRNLKILMFFIGFIFNYVCGKEIQCSNLHNILKPSVEITYGLSVDSFHRSTSHL